ncbi:DHHW family protein [Brevibacillus migulae]|uniref:DHHW family protein n=1 Tax=Brevibacillus migulae TaxID=1644114 RepID=UPI00106EA026|nr:DHHW family protein [Brevibacillus migulae]
MRIAQIVQIVFFILFLCAGIVMNTVHGDHESISETENRALAALPRWSSEAFWSGAFLRGLENYLADHVAYRDSLVRVSNLLSSWRGLPGRGDAFIVASQADNTADSVGRPAEKQMGPQPTTSLSPTTSPSTAAQTAVAKPVQKQKSGETEPGRVIGKVLIVGNRAMYLYSYVPAAGMAFADTVNAFRAELTQRYGQQVHLSVLLAPSAVEFVENPQLKSLSSSQEQAIMSVYEQIDEAVTKVNATPYLREHAAEELFFRTDHHWTATGAYYAYQAFMEARGIPPVPLTQYKTQKVNGFLGSLYASTLNKKLEAHPDTILLYQPFIAHQYQVYYSGPLKMKLLDMNHANRKNKYRIFLSGDRPWGKIATQVNNNRRIAVIKDSYGNAFIPFLLPHFQEIYIIDPRQFDKPLYSFIEDHQINEVLILANTTITTYSGFTDLIRKRMQAAPEEK